MCAWMRVCVRACLFRAARARVVSVSVRACVQNYARIHARTHARTQSRARGPVELRTHAHGLRGREHETECVRACVRACVCERACARMRTREYAFTFTRVRASGRASARLCERVRKEGGGTEMPSILFS